VLISKILVMEKRTITIIIAIFISFCGFSQSQLIQAEYFIDTDPGPGNGTSIAISVGDSVTKSFILPTTGLNFGFHSVGVRVKNGDGLWSSILSQTFYVFDTTSHGVGVPVNIPSLSQAEYFIDSDPGVGNGTAIIIVSGDSLLETFQFSTSGLNVGIHTANVRVRNSNGLWSSSMSAQFYVYDTTNYSYTRNNPQLVAAEYFFNTDPGVGNGTSIPISLGDSILWNGDLDISSLMPGVHKLCIRTKNAQGLWSIAQVDTFTVVDCLHPEAEFSMPNQICLGDSLHITDLSDSIHATESFYTWDIGNNGSVEDSTMGSISTLLPDTGVYSVKLFILNQGVCSDSAIHDVYVRPLPEATINANGNTSFCQGNMVILNANTGVGLLYDWFNNNTSLGATYSVYGATMDGIYHAKVTNQYGCEKTSNTVPVTVYSLPSATITASGSTNICQGESLTLNANTGVGLSYLWKRNGDTIPGETSSSLVVNQAGNYAVEIMNTNNCKNLSADINVNVIPLPNAIITPGGNTTICQGEILHLYGTSGSGYSYQWIKNGNAIINSTGTYHSVIESGNYQVVVTNSSGCFDTSAVQTAVVHSSPASSISLSGGAIRCQGDSVLLHTNYDSGNSYQWRRYSTDIQGYTDTLMYAKQSGNYTLVTTNSYNCSTESNPQTITFNTLPGASILPLGSSSFCDGDSVNLQATIGNSLSYQWYKNGVVLVGQTNAQYMAKSNGSFHVEVSNSNNCQSVSMPLTVTVYAVPNSSFALSNESCAADTVLVSYTGTGSSGAFYNWNFDGGTILSGTGQGPYQVKWDSAGYKNVQLTVSENACQSIPSPTKHRNQSRSRQPKLSQYQRVPRR
jgi:hypothetical protein